MLPSKRAFAPGSRESRLAMNSLSVILERRLPVETSYEVGKRIAEALHLHGWFVSRLRAARPRGPGGDGILMSKRQV